MMRGCWDDESTRDGCESSSTAVCSWAGRDEEVRGCEGSVDYLKRFWTVRFGCDADEYGDSRVCGVG